MKARPACIPCQVTFALEMAKRATEDEAMVGEILFESLRIIREFGLDLSPPRVAREIIQMAKRRTGVEDPYRKEKEEQNRMGMKLYEMLGGKATLDQALAFSAAGNIIDSIAVKERIDPRRLLEELRRSERRFSRDGRPHFKERLKRASSLLIVGDNAGEIVLDRLLAERIKEEFPHLRITYAVRGGAAINDATLEDAEEVGMREVCEVISTGDDAPGVILEDCSREFRERFARADLILAKGQGNFETLDELKEPRVFFLLQAKCQTICEYLGVKRSSLVLTQVL